MIKGNIDLKESLGVCKKIFKNKNFEKAEKLYKKILREIS